MFQLFISLNEVFESLILLPFLLIFTFDALFLWMFYDFYHSYFLELWECLKFWEENNLSRGYLPLPLPGTCFLHNTTVEPPEKNSQPI